MVKRGVEVQPIIKGCPEQGSAKKKVLLATINISDGDIWTCGLFQNVLYLYKLLEIAGFTPYFFVNNNDKNNEFMKQYRVIDHSDWNSNPFWICAFIEVGMLTTSYIRGVMKTSGANIFKLCLGNNLNIDTETVVFSKHADYYSYNGPNLDTILVSPHYDLHQEYITVIDHIYPSVKIAPYVWEPLMLKELCDSHSWKSTGPYSVTIIEPNMSFQKCSLIPIMICESYYRSNSDNVDGVVVIGGQKLRSSSYFNNTILQNLDLNKKGKIHFMGRYNNKTLSQRFNYNIIILHHVNNEYNYVFLEYLYMGFPIIHNYANFKDFGYYYEGNDINGGKKMLETVIKTHGENIESYKAKCKQLIWNFSINNPVNIKGWQDILEG